MSNGNDDDDKRCPYFTLVRLIAMWPLIYVYIIQHGCYKPATNPNVEDKRKKWLFEANTMIAMIALYMHGELHQSELGSMLSKDGEYFGTKIKQWVTHEDKLKHFNLIDVKKVKVGEVYYNIYFLTEFGKDMMNKVKKDMGDFLDPDDMEPVF